MFKSSGQLLATILLTHDLASLNGVSFVVKADQPVHCKYNIFKINSKNC